MQGNNCNETLVRFRLHVTPWRNPRTEVIRTASEGRSYSAALGCAARVLVEPAAGVIHDEPQFRFRGGEQ